MFNHSTYRALTITALLFSILAIGLFNIYLHSPIEDGFSVSYYIEEEDDEEEETIASENEEELENVEALETHRAYNEAQEQITKAEQNFIDSKDAFEEHMQAMDEAIKDSEKQSDLPEETPIESYSQSDEVIHNENVKRNSSVSYSLENRMATSLPNPVYTCPSSGTIVINITVDSMGEVINTHVDNPKSTTSDRCLKEQALEYANQARFDVLESSNENQKGTITYRFIGS